MAEPRAEVAGVEYRVGRAVILRDTTARFRTGRFNAILGPNGAGKSTLLKVASGLLTPTAGAAFFDGRPVSAFAPDALARKRAVLSQHVSLAFPLPVEQVVLMGRYPHYGRSPSARDREIVAKALELVAMTDRRNQAYSTLSGGEQQKVQLARVLAQIWNFDDSAEHKYLFLDEPTTSLDVHYQIHLLDVARELLRYNCTVIAILHDLNVAFEYGESFFLMSRGTVAREADSVRDLPIAEIENIFQVRARQIADSAGGQDFWRFSLS